jgi:hypothetical protein
MRGRYWLALLIGVFCAAAVAVSLLFEGPRNLYFHAIYICLDCIGLV